MPPFVNLFLETVAAQNESLFFPLLDIISKEKHMILSKLNFDNYNYLRNLVYDYKIMRDNISLSILDYALALHSSAPKIQAYYNYYNDVVVSEMISRNFTSECKNWILFNGRQYCDIDKFLESKDIEVDQNRPVTLLSFDHIFDNNKNGDSPLAILYADLSSNNYITYHSFLYEKAKLGDLKYVFRYKPEDFNSNDSLYLSGYGVEASLKKTDYLVMDDRKIIEDVHEKMPSQSYSSEVNSSFFFSNIQDNEIKSLTNTELKELGFSITQFVMESKTPLETLNYILQDFPKYASYLSTIKINKKTLKKLTLNYKYLNPGETVFSINGLKIKLDKINGFSLLKYLRKEYDLISSLQNLGLSLEKAKSLITDKAISELFNMFLNIRFDFRDSYDDGNVILWLNDIENDPTYMHFSQDIYQYLDELPNGELHMIRRNLHHVIIPLDFSKKFDMIFFRDIFFFIQRLFPIRFGILPVWQDPKDIFLVKIFYHLFSTYGINSAIEYILYLDPDSRHNETILSRNYNFILFKYEQDIEIEDLDINNIIKSKKIEQYILKTKEWSLRLGIENDDFLIVNGKFLEKKQNWDDLSFNIFMNDVDVIRKKIVEKSLNNNVNILDYLLEDAVYRRDSYVHPMDSLPLTVVFFKIFTKNLFSIENLNTELSFWLIADFDTKKGLEFAKFALEYMIEHPYTSLRFLHNPKLSNKNNFDYFSSFLFLLSEKNIDVTESVLNYIQKLLNSYDSDGIINREIEYPYFILNIYNSTELLLNSVKAKLYWEKMKDQLDKLEFSPGEFGLLANGHVIGPFPESYDSLFDSFKLLGDFHNFSIISQLKTITERLDIKNSRCKMFFPVLFSILLSHIVFEKYDFTYFSQFGRDKIYTLTQKLTPSFTSGNQRNSAFEVKVVLDPLNEISQKLVPVLKVLEQMEGVYIEVYLNPLQKISKLSINRFYRYVLQSSLKFNIDGDLIYPSAIFERLPISHLYTIDYDFPGSWIVTQKRSIYDLDNLLLSDLFSKKIKEVVVIYELKYILIEGHAEEIGLKTPSGIQLALKTKNNIFITDTIVMSNFGYFQFKANPGVFKIDIITKESNDILKILKISDKLGSNNFKKEIILESFEGLTIFPTFIRYSGKNRILNLEELNKFEDNDFELENTTLKFMQSKHSSGSTFDIPVQKFHAEINIFSIASGHLYERFLYIMILSVLKHTKHTVKVWFIENFLSSSFKNFLPYVANEFGFQYELITYRWPYWLRSQKEKQRQIWGYKILFLDVLFPLELDNIIFVDADQIVRTDLKELVDMDLQGAPYGYTPMCDSRKEMEDYRFWKKGYWKSHLKGKPYHISALYVVDLKKFREIGAGDILRQHYQALSQDPESLSNLDQDLPNNLQDLLPIFSLPQNWLWCKTWCSDESLKDAKTIDLCNNPMTKESKLERARNQVPEWNEYDKIVANLIARILEQRNNEASESSVDNIAISVDVMENIQFNSGEENKKKSIHDEF
ncbi:unnamed protein product [Pneumocystis jirovecii]|uniref:Glucosyltransferase 24 catalytic domain-containing protein n=1 Tax=Pneumocystis jirovecii TaxID=42068 RepID=L0PBY5_PNEJI|nr:unnamed protein product [Pneumocystis jirovecii]